MLPGAAVTPVTGAPQQVFTCRICHCRAAHEAFQVREMMFGSREEFAYFQCARCGCLQIAQIPEDLHRHYPAGYYSHAATPGSAPPKVFRSALERLLICNALFQRGYTLSRFARRFISLPDYFFRTRPELLKRAGVRDFYAAILDVGCGSQAQWLSDLRLAGFRNLLGIDPFADADLQVPGMPVRRTDVVSFAGKWQGRFDLIALHHSLEHIPDQLATLRAVRALLAPDGTCVVRIPTVSSLAWSRYGVNWVELDAPRHLYLHSKHSLKTLAAQAGLDLFDIHYDTTAFEFYGSEQYQLDVPLTAPHSLWVNPHSTLFPPEKLLEFEASARQVNSDHNAGRACFYLRQAR